MHTPAALVVKTLEGAGDRVMADAHQGECRLDPHDDPARHAAHLVELCQLLCAAAQRFDARDVPIADRLVQIHE